MIYKNNKGFTLVELIIVIAIIAVLAAVLAPQYMRYVESARKANDLQVATNIIKATKAAIADPLNEVPVDTDIFVVWETDDFDTDIAGRLYVDTTYNLDTAGEDGFEYNLTKTIGEILGGEEGTGSVGEWMPDRVFYFAGVPESEAAKQLDFKFTVNSSTGVIKFYNDKFSDSTVTYPDDSYVWFSEIGVKP